VEQIRAAELRWARCMRFPQVPNWPDPTLDAHGMPVFNVTRGGSGRQFIRSPPIVTPKGECRRLIAAPVPRE